MTLLLKSITITINPTSKELVVINNRNNYNREPMYNNCSRRTHYEPYETHYMHTITCYQIIMHTSLTYNYA